MTEGKEDALLPFQSVESISGRGELRFVLVDTPELCASAIKALSKSTILALDCEGRNLGRSGTLAVLQLCNDEGKSFIFDLVPDDNFKVFFDLGLREILESTEIVKVLHDCRCDVDALFHLANVSLRNAVDMQIANALTKLIDGTKVSFPAGYGKLVLFVDHVFNLLQCHSLSSDCFICFGQPHVARRESS